MHRTQYLTVLSPLLLVTLAVAQGSTKPGSLRAKRALNEVLQPSEAELSKRVTPVVRAVRSTANSVVSVLITGNRLSGFRRGSMVEGQGSGVIIDETGLVLTNWHVVARAAAANSGSQVEIRLKSGAKYNARVLSTSPEYDLALLQLKLPANTRLEPLTMGDSSSLMIGETVIAIGNPKGHANTVTVGVLSAEDREITVRTPDGRVRKYQGLLQTDAAINQGNSGGALLDITGRLIGINNAMSPTSENIGFAIPVNTVRRVFHEVLLSSENLTSVYLGMTVAEANGAPVLSKVAAGGPADRAGLKNGDQILSINGKRVSSTIEYARAILGVSSGKPLAIRVRRKNRELTGRPVPLSNAAWTVIRRIGAEFEVVTRKQEPKLLEVASKQLYRELRKRSGRGLSAILRVRTVHKNSPAHDLGIAKGDVLLGIVDQVPDLFTTRNIINTFPDLRSLNDALHVMANRRVREFNVWVLRKGEVMDGQMVIPRL
ncbi:MAG: trypsin-like peptidase domain-containing protein [Planctomycetota bacterium]|nr:trypsin-like peptidase domain-containing protein [Planctomycetota bacterium]